jgi:imidazoleglycerol phosphate synthase glutamine amidotransferase subunit HisH
MLRPIPEAEALKKWCPLARLPVPGVGAVNRAINRVTRDSADQILHAEVDLSLSHCLGSECMWWRTISSSDSDGWCGGTHE